MMPLICSWLALEESKDPMTTAQLADMWLRKNQTRLTQIAFAVMKEEVGRDYSVAPLVIQGFSTDESRRQYHNSLVQWVFDSEEPMTFQSVALLHCEWFLDFARRKYEA